MNIVNPIAIFMIVCIVSILVLSLTNYIITYEFIHWWIKNRLWNKKPYSVIFGSNGEVGLEIVDGYAITTKPTEFEYLSYALPEVIVVSVPEEGANNTTLNSYWVGRGFNPSFDFITLNARGIFPFIRPSLYMLRHLEKQYKEEILLIEKMYNL